jgi:catechol 2,3-dioxygenase-like lactoylglutathione lyase family enzyme
MKRFHVHVGVSDLEANIRFYSGLFGAAPTVRKADYAKWMVDDPRLNFAISARGSQPGVNHLGLQVDTGEELEGMRAQLAAADASLVEEVGAKCCYAESDKYWVTDPQGVAWETYHSLASIPRFGSDDRAVEAPAASACCSSSGPARVDAQTPVKAKGCCA